MEQSNELKKVQVETNWDLMYLGPYICEIEGLSEGEKVLGWMEDDEWIGIVRCTALKSRWSSWYLEIIE